LICIGINAVDGNRPIATLINYALHPVTLSYSNLKLSGDVPGSATARLQALRGGGATLYLQGACGDVNPISDLRTGWGNGTVEDVAHVGERLAQAAHAALQRAMPTTDVHLNATHGTVNLPLDPPPAPAQLDNIIARFEADLRHSRAEGHLVNEGIALAWLRWAAELKGALANNAVPTSQAIEVWAAAINDLRIAAVPLESYSDIGLDFKRSMRPHTGIFLGYANGLLGYCATDWAKAQGGYGPDEACRWFPQQLTAVGYGAAQRVVDTSTALAHSMILI
jgi:hypothetical protein